MSPSRLRKTMLLVAVPASALAGALLAGQLQQSATTVQATTVQANADTTLTQVSSELPGAMLLAQATPTSQLNRTVMSPTCQGCHASNPKVPIKGARLGYNHSGHALNGNSWYANGDGCQQCHTHEGFVDFTKNGKLTTAFIANPSQPGCMTCHQPHETGNMGLRVTKAVTLTNKKTFDGGKGNLCASCHQSRSDVAKGVPTEAQPAARVGPRSAAHHGPQADMMVGTNAYEFAGKTYSSGDHYGEIDNTCVTCHMGLPKGRYGLSAAIGGHGMNMAADVHENEVLNTAGCVSCHKDIKTADSKRAWSKAGGAGVTWVPSSKIYAITAEADYDQDGTKEYMQDEVQGLMDRLVNQQGTGAMQKNVPFFDAKGAYIGDKAAAGTTYTRDQMGALYNYRFVLEDRSRGIHNTTYTIQLLIDSLAALDPTFNASARPK